MSDALRSAGFDKQQPIALGAYFAFTAAVLISKFAALLFEGVLQVIGDSLDFIFI
jgi:hypothetical protein